MSQSYRKKSSKGPSRDRDEWSDWGRWCWSQTYEQYYRQRQDRHGNIQTVWATEHNAGRDAPAEPRHKDDVDALADQLGQADLEDAGDEEPDQEYSYKSSSKHKGKPSTSGKGKSSSSDKGKSKSTSSSSRAKKPKGHPQDETIEEGDEDDGAAEGYEDQEQLYEDDEEQDYAYPGQPYQGNTSSSGYGRSYQQETYPQNTTGYVEEEADEQDEQYQEAKRRSKRDHHGSHHHRGESSRHQESSSSKSKRPPDEYYDKYAYEQGGSEGLSSKPRVKFDISGKEGSEYEVLDPRYRIEPSRMFEPGEVFKVLWSEPSGQSAAGTGTISDTGKIEGPYGGIFHVSFRRFIVIANDHGHCQCIPILTYGRKGCKKNGVKAEKHGMVYDSRAGPKKLEGEPELGFHPVCLIITVDGEKLARESRVNYSKIVTVEHNVKVFFIGHIDPNDFQIVSGAVDACWEDKVVRQRKKQGRREEGA